MRKIIDIGANLTDDVFRGLYRGKQAHPSDVESVIGRARSIGMDKMIITAGTVEDAREAVQLAKTSDMVWSFRSLIRILTLLITSFTRPLEFTRPDVADCASHQPLATLARKFTRYLGVASSSFGTLKRGNL